MHAVQKEAECCKSGEVVDMEYHHDVRQGSSTALACFAPFEPVLSIDLPNEVVEHSVFEEILVIGIDLFCWSNVSCITWATSSLLTQRVG